jgi:hypothetical protein
VTGPTLAFLLLVLFSIGILVVMGIGLFRNGMRVARAVAAFVEAATPLADEISADADRAAEHVQRLAEAAASIRKRD